MLRQIFLGKIENGLIKINRVKDFTEYKKSLEGKEIQVLIEPKKKQRSTPQNSLYWVWLNFLGEELGEWPDDLHSTFKSMFLVDKTRRIPIVRSTTRLSSFEFSEYLCEIERLMAEMNIRLPHPEDLYISEGIEPTQIM